MGKETTALLDEMQSACYTANRIRFGKARVQLERILEMGTGDPLEAVCTVPEMALRLGKSERDVRRCIDNGELRARKGGGTWLIHEEEE